MLFRLYLALSLAAHVAFASAPECTQALLEGQNPPSTLSLITPRVLVQPFYEWYSNNGYCGEVSLLQAGLNFGQWMSQFNARLICGSGLSQTGPDGFCAAHKQNANYNAQLLLESPLPGDSPFASAPMCLANARLDAEVFDHAHQAPGLPGYRQFMSWIKSQLIAGNQVAIPVLHYGESSPEYDHIVTVSQVGTNHSTLDPSYYDDDVLYFEDHGSLTLSGATLSPHHPSIPMAAESPAQGCNPYFFGYTFASLAKTREQANVAGAQKYSIIIPGIFPTVTQTGGDGINTNPSPVVGGNYGFAVSGPLDTQKVTLPVQITIVGSTTDGTPNPADPVAGFGYENPMIGDDVDGNACTNSPPTQKMEMSLQVTVSGLQVGASYNLYEYDFDQISGVGAAAALAVPSSNFNANANLAADKTQFVASTAKYVRNIQIASDKVVVFRCVPSNAP